MYIGRRNFHEDVIGILLTTVIAAISLLNTIYFCVRLKNSKGSTPIEVKFRHDIKHDSKMVSVVSICRQVKQAKKKTS